LQAAFIVAHGILRSVLATAIDVVRDIGSLTAAVAASCCLPLVLLEGGNITMRPLADVFSRPVVRALEIFAALVDNFRLGGFRGSMRVVFCNSRDVHARRPA
jgi:hypothetical protein